MSAFEGVPQKEIPRGLIKEGLNILDALCEKTDIFSSKGEARRMIKNNGLLINRKRINSLDYILEDKDLLNGNIIVAQKGKKNYFLIKAK